MKISVVVPNYNHGASITQTIDGILSQTYRNFELIIVDDGSTDESVEILKRYQQLDSRIHLLLFSENRGVTAAVTEGIRAASGKLLFAEAADDYLIDPTFFAAAVDLMRRRPKASGVFGRSRVIDAANDSFLWSMGAGPKEGYSDGQTFLDAFLSHRTFVPGSSAMFRLELIREAGGHQADLGPQSDYFVNHALPAAHGVFFLDRDVAAFRVSPNTYSAKATDEDFFRGHALTEKRLRAYAPARHYDPALLRTWRDGILNMRLNMWRQEAFFDAVKAVARELPPWEKRGMPRDFMQLAERYLDELTPMKAELDRRAAAARAIFSEVAGPLDGQSDPIAQRAHRLRNLFWKTMFR
jgi:glycosyltransferase involved in cell wall biosynthesis